MSAQGISLNIRAIQSDLESISGTGLFAICADTSSKPTGWCWVRDATEPAMTGNPALMSTRVGNVEQMAKVNVLVRIGL